MRVTQAKSISTPVTSMLVNGWTLFAHPLITNQVETLIGKVRTLQLKDPAGYLKNNAAKRLAAVNKLAFEVIPADPALSEYRQVNTLGDEHRHWFRAKFFQHYRLFFRYHAQTRIIVYAWINDDNTKRAFESSNDAYRVVSKMLQSGHPPDDWNHLVDEANLEAARFNGLTRS